ncbi:hypothetical protein [Stenotrophomonas sp. NRRL B-14846]|uniref:hypothetical protein n=1 Tax=Stenotrophomonas sp. NRRL B-14846 TaxID=3162882 RepID=UPI003D2DEEEE
MLDWLFSTVANNSRAWLDATGNVAFGTQRHLLPASDEIATFSKFPTILIGSIGASCKSCGATDNGWHGLPIPLG